MKNLYTLIFLVFITFNLSGQTTWFGPNYVHLNSTSNCYGDYTILDTMAIGGNIADIVIFTHVWGFEGSHESYMTKSCGLWHTGSEWSIFDETEQLMDTNLAFNVLNANTNGTGFAHTVTSENLIENFTIIDNPLLNDHPEKIFFITKIWTNGVYDTAHVGVWYDAAEGKWTIYNESGYPSILELNSVYNIFVPDEGTSYLKHIADGTSYVTVIDDFRLNGNENARIFAVHDYSTSGGTPGYIDDEIGVWYNGSNWTIYSENYTPLFVGASFNVLIVAEIPEGMPNANESSCKLKVFPNPAKDKLGILMNKNLTDENIAFRIVTMDGRTVLEKSAMGNQNSEFSLDIRELESGLYFLYATTSKGTFSAKVNIVK
jgi:hypothetical protein